MGELLRAHLSSIRLEVRANESDSGRKTAQEVAPECRGRTTPLMVSGWHLAPTEQSLDPDSPPANEHDNSPLEVHLETPETVKPGELMTFTVRLANTSEQPYSLNPCPKTG